MDNCLFCRIIKKELNSKIIYEDELSLCFEDINPKAPAHFLIIPKKHIPTHADLTKNDLSIMGHLHMVIHQIAKKYELDRNGYRIVMNCKESAGQAVFHIHFHLMGGRTFQWPPG